MGFGPQERHAIFLFAEMSRQVVGQRVWGFFPGGKVAGVWS